MNSAIPESVSPVTSSPATVIAVRDLRHRYGEREALRGITFEILAGEIFGFLGPNGGGKSTLFRILSTMIDPTSGEVSLLGHDPGRELSAVRRALGVVFQAPSLDPLLTAGENLMHQGHLYGLKGAALRDRSRELLAVMGLSEREKDRVADFSGGMRRRLEIAKSLLHEPRLLLLDEPTTGLDPSARLDVWEHLRRLRNTRGVTIVFTTHLMEEAEGCDRLAILDQGSLVAVDTPHQLRHTIEGEVVTVDAEDPEATARILEETLGVNTTQLAGRIRIESDKGAELVRKIMETLPDRVQAVSVAHPTLDDVFMQLTGHHFEGGARAGASSATPSPRKRGRR